MRKLLRWIRDAWLILGVTLLLVLLLDGALKAWLPEHAGWPQVRQGASAPDRRQADALAGSDWVDGYFSELKAARHTRWEPYVYWRRQAFAGTWINVDQAGLRRTWQADDEPSLTLWMFGGSTVWGTGARDEHTLPSALARALWHRGVRARVVNFGESGYVSTQGAVALIRALQAYPPPDAVVFHDGVNDVFAALQSGQAGWPQNERLRHDEFRVTDGLDNYLSAFPRTLEGIARLVGERQPLAIDPLAEEVVAAYGANVRSVRALATGRGFKRFFFWQPTVFTRSRPSPSEQQVIAASLTAHRDLQLATNQVLTREAITWGITDLSAVFDGDDQPVYLDFCHLSEAGNQRLAEVMAERMVASLIADQPVQPPATASD